MRRIKGSDTADRILILRLNMRIMLCRVMMGICEMVYKICKNATEELYERGYGAHAEDNARGPESGR